MVFTGICLLLGVIAHAFKEKPTAKQNEATAVATTDKARALFNGHDLTGWSVIGTNVWRVEGGVIQADLTGSARTYLVLNQGVNGAFECAFDYKPLSGVSGNGSYGLFYLCAFPPNGSPQPGTPFARGFGIILGGINGQLYASGMQLPPVDRRADWRWDEWNRVVVRVERDRLTHSINGVPVYSTPLAAFDQVPRGNQIAFEIWNDTEGSHRSVQIRSITLQTSL